MSTLSISKNTPPQASEMFSAGWCNLKCKYCYIPKDNTFLMDFHKKIKQGIKDGSTLKKIYELFGKNLTIFSHWGTEPTLTLLDHIPEFYEEALKLFPNFNKISFSSNYMVGSDIIPKFVENFPATDRQIELDLQVSIDGPKWITDKNRGEGSTEKIIKNCLEVIRLLNSVNNKNGTVFTFIMHFKPTASMEDIKKMGYNFSVIESYYRFFDEFFTKCKETNVNNKINISYSCDPTIVLPTDFTQEDGFAMSKLYDFQLRLSGFLFNNIRPNSAYFHRLTNRLPIIKEWSTKHRMFSCSSGDGTYSVNENHNVVPCHRVFYITNKDYVETSKKCLGDLIKTDEATINNLAKNYCADSNNQLDIDRLLMLMRGYNDFTKFKESYGITTIRLMAQAEQLSSIYKNEEMARLLNYFILGCISCPIENISTGGSIFIQHSSLFKLFGNGFFEKLLRNCLIRETMLR